MLPRSVAAQSAAAAAEPAAKKAAKAKTKAKAAAKTAPKGDATAALKHLESGAASLQAGKAEVAVQQLTAALTGGQLPSQQMARAQYLRGLAYRKTSKPALAISDLTQALWLKNGLNETERADALQNRIAAYRDAGLPDQDDGQAAKASAAAPVRTTVGDVSASGATGSTGSIPDNRPSASLAPTTDSATAPTSGGIAGFFGSIFGGAGSGSGDATASTGTASATAKPAQREVATSAWSTDVELKSGKKGERRIASAAGKEESLPWLQGNPASSPTAPATRTAAVAPAAAPGAASGKFRLQVGQLKTEAEAQAVAAKLKQMLGAELGGRDAAVTAVQAGGFGTLHRVTFGPFASAAEWKTLCPKLLAAGHDCLPLQ